MLSSRISGLLVILQPLKCWKVLNLPQFIATDSGYYKYYLDDGCCQQSLLRRNATPRILAPRVPGKSMSLNKLQPLPVVLLINILQQPKPVANNFIKLASILVKPITVARTCYVPKFAAAATKSGRVLK